VTIEARERTSSLNYAQALLETTPDELNRAIAPARRYRVHLEVRGLTIEWQDGLWGAEHKEEGGVVTYDAERTEPITYRIRVVT
jgi:hypothetical protein